MLFFDIETSANNYALQFMDEPTAPANYKDPEKIAAYIAEKKEEQAGRAALDPDYGKIIALSWRTEEQPIQTILVDDTISEADLINKFWKVYANQFYFSCGYNIISFDLPYLMRRSFDLRLVIPARPDLRRFQLSPTLDLMQVLFNWGQAKSLKFVARRYNLYDPLPDLDGSKVGEMDAETLALYSANGVELVYDLWQKMKGIYF